MIRPRCVLVVLFAALACSAGTEPPLDGPYVALTVSGTIRTTDGASVSGATVDVWARSPGTCTGGFADARATSGTGGEFTRTMATWNVPRDVCVWIAVVPPSGSGLAADTVTVEPARLDVVASVLTVDLVLSALPES